MEDASMRSVQLMRQMELLRKAELPREETIRVPTPPLPAPTWNNEPDNDGEAPAIPSPRLYDSSDNEPSEEARTYKYIDPKTLQRRLHCSLKPWRGITL